MKQRHEQNRTLTAPRALDHARRLMVMDWPMDWPHDLHLNETH
jgi:hypothetical protein